MTTVSETPLPGVGVRFEFVTNKGIRLGVLQHQSGRIDLVLYDRNDPDTASESVVLDEEDARTLGELLGSSRVVEELGKLRQRIEGLALDWLPIDASSPFVGRTIGDTGARTRTGVSIVAVVRGDDAIPAPEPDQGLEAGDTLVVVGTPRGIEDLVVILRAG
ncbi:MAG TPA: cation:proton antiporter regulatory subunit [Actinomycetota bacterium]|nr:cation:proton antiporter regulatory subunit [Actinomycetota bacterium]HJR98984.1 cation:proton antiporter regulatory subunit [Actinomycetota bacterium]